MILFLCETLYTLFNAVHIKSQCFPNEHADILLTSTSKYDDYIERVKSKGIFDEIFISDFSLVNDINELRQNMSRVLRSPEKYKFALKSTKQYTDYFLPIATSDYEKVIFYQISQNGTVPQVHFYDEGILSYYEDINASICNDVINHNKFPREKQFKNNIADIYLFEPELITMPGNTITGTAIPKIDTSDTEYIKMLTSIFGECELPKEKYIFLEECFWVENKNTNEIDILDKIAEHVGKENIIVKLHPRTVHNVFAYHGYKTFLESNIPWEMFMLNSEFEKKILITVSSGSAVTAKIMYDKNCNSIYLWKMMTLSRRYHAKVKNFEAFFRNLMKLYNKDRRNLLCPSGIDELVIGLKYMEGTIDE